MTRNLVVIVALVIGACSSDEPLPTPEPEQPVCPASTPGAVVLINELMADNEITALDDAGIASDWVELYNPGPTDVSLCGYALTNDFDDPRAAVLGPQVVVPGGGYVVIWLTGRSDLDLPLHLPIALRKGGGELGLSDPDGAWVDRVVYGAQEVDFSAARTPDGSDLWAIEWHVSPGAPNPPGDGLPSGRDEPGADPEQVPEAGDLTERILSYDALPILGLELGPAELQKLRVAPRIYVPGHLVYDGRRYGPVGIRLKGSNSFQPIDEKPSFRINIDEYVSGAKFFGLKDLTLNNMTEDFSMMHERLSYYVARHVGPASRCNHALVTVNGQAYGLYANVESVKRHIMARWFDDGDGALFEATDVDFVPALIPSYEVQAGPDDRRLLEGAAEALTDPTPANAIARVSDYVHMDSLFAYWAMAAVVGQFDAFPYSVPGDDYFVYADPGTDRLWFLPWGMDETFYSGQHDVTKVSSILATTCLAVPSCRRAWTDQVWQTVELVEELDLLGEVDRVAAQIAPHVAMDQRKIYSDETVAEFQGHLRWFLRGRRANLAAMIGPPPP